ncbi:MAG: DUF5678 domain-containing protein [Pyrinomonadaceae bacterium]
MSTAVIDEVVETLNAMSLEERLEVFQQLKEPPVKTKTKTNGKKGYVSPDTIWVRENSHKYRGMHVAIKNGKLIATGRTIKEADQAARAKGIDRPLLTYIPGEDEVIWGGW